MKKLFVFILITVFGMSVAAQTKTLTNAELEKFRQERLKAEADYRKNYAKMGFPSPEELAEINAQKRRELERVANQIQREKFGAQNDILTRANALRAQIASVEAQIAFLRRQNGGSSNQTVYYSGFGYQNYGYRNPRLNFRQPRQPQQLPPNLQTVQNISRMYPNSTDIYNRSVGNYAYQNQRPRGGGFYRGNYVTPVIINGNYAQTELNSQIIYLEQIRAGLLAQWQLIEEEARRAGVKGI